ncbi:hypothetical protein N7457_002314 [Penicillium paradoxum]|uniref:uncharacterized protein n=1 Tax=Penicillium paradoxum TaxID=176176 RepID=UPI002549B973|nr:uncharacterized protein N7457_002314 [Penicillium paradoxum]KAJ5787324.1 hypothetical protein N7457_002314 [Penicillium paradoxum]
MVPSYLLVGLLTALCHSAHGLEFIDKIQQNVEGNTLSLLHDVEDATSVKFGTSPDSQTQGWKFNTEGFSDDDAVITPSNSSKTLVCEKGSKCKLDLNGSKQPYRVVRVDEENPTFTFQDLSTSLYVSRTSDLYLELTDVVSESIYFHLAAIRDNHEEI